MHIGEDILAPEPVARDFLRERPLGMRRKIRKRAQPAENELRDFALPCRAIDAADADEIFRQGFHFGGKIELFFHHIKFTPSTRIFSILSKPTFDTPTTASRSTSL